MATALPEDSTPWYRLHLVTCFLLAMQAWAVWDYATEDRVHRCMSNTFHESGWPFEAGSYWHGPMEQGLNDVCGVAILLTTAVVAEGLLRRGVQFSLADLGWLTLTVAVLMALWTQWPSTRGLLALCGLDLFRTLGPYVKKAILVSPENPIDPCAVLTQVRAYPVLLGAACAVHGSAWALVETVKERWAMHTTPDQPSTELISST